MKPYLKLIKFWISLSVAFSTIVGSFISRTNFSNEYIISAIGVFFLAAAASAINQIQEKPYDARMLRTYSRPIPMEVISTKTAWIIVCVLIIIGSIILAKINLLSLELGLLNIIIYNGIYTPLKRKTILAILPGAIVGAIPPIIGYISVGGIISNFEILLFSLYMVLWQVPHFWILTLKYGEEYKNAGFVTMLNFISKPRLIYLIIIWEIIIFWLGIGFIFFGIIQDKTIGFLFIFAQILFFTAIIIMQILNKNEQYRKLAFICFNSLLLINSILLIIDSRII